MKVRKLYLYVVLLTVYISYAQAGVDDCEERPRECCAYSCENVQTVVDHLESDLGALKRSFESKLMQMDEKLGKAEIQAHHVKTLQKELDEIENTLWNTFHFILALVGLATLLGIVFIWRENAAAKKALELEELQLKQRKAEIESQIKESLEKLEEKAATELMLFRKKLTLQEVIITGTVDQDGIYDSIRYMDRKPRYQYSAIYGKLLKLDLDAELKETVLAAQKRAKEAGN